MPLAIAFWVIMIVGALFGLYTNRDAAKSYLSSHLVYFVLFALLGWAVFGPALHR